MTEYFFNGQQMDEDEFERACEEAHEETLAEEARVLLEYPGIDEQCASYICYLRTRSRWTLAKELELVRRSRAGEELPNVLAGEF